MVDSYSWGARAVPGIIVVLPAAVALFTVFPRFSSGVGGICSGTGITLAFLLLVSAMARYFGHRVEPALWARWGGPPTTRFLRWSDRTQTPQWKRLVHRKVFALTGIRLLGPREEPARPKEADALITDACGILTSRLRRDAGADLVAKANMEYGFARNLMGCSGLWWRTSGISTGICLAARMTGIPRATAGAVICALCFAVALFAGFVALPALAKRSADRYAHEFWSVIANKDVPRDGKDAANG